ncbi:MAG: hypothetical protein SPK28_03295 [Bacilli bacterium]|nr:hypothetical protein [Bacilli bacterium]
MSRLSPKAAKIVIWSTIGATGALSGGGIGGIIAHNVIKNKTPQMEEIDISQLVDDNKDLDARYESWISEHTYSEDLSSEFTAVEMLQIGFSLLEASNEYAIESTGYLTTHAGIEQEQFITSAKVRKNDLFFNESNSKNNGGMVKMEIGSRYLYSGSTIDSYERASLYVAKGKYVHSTYNNKIIQSYSTDEFKSINACDITDPCIYFISSKTIDSSEQYTPVVSKENSTYTFNVRFTYKACGDYMKQIVNTSDGKVSKVTNFKYTDWKVVLGENLLPISIDIDEEYVTKALGINATCHNEMSQKFYYDNISIPELNEPYILKEEM